MRPPAPNFPPPPVRALQVLEAHIVAALGKATRHLVLIGDHQQLRPSTAVYRLAKQFALDVSLFERLVRAGVDHVTLRTQRRMRPEVSALVHHIYPALQDHAVTLERPRVAGVLEPVFFVQHARHEDSVGEARSRVNTHEATFLAALASWLLRCGHSPEALVVLTPYCGQLVALRAAFREAGGCLCEVPLRSVDEYQGEEADIVLLSLVRSNADGSIGFLGVDNRVCVALSRARIGLYIVGNGALLRAKRPLWESVLRTLEAAGQTGPFLPLDALRASSGKPALAAAAEDFDDLQPAHSALPPAAIVGDAD